MCIPHLWHSRGAVKDIEYAGYCTPADLDRCDVDRFALGGFGSDPHGCLDLEFAQMEMKLIVSTLLRDYDWTVIPEKAAIAPIRQPSKIQDRVQARFRNL